MNGLVTLANLQALMKMMKHKEYFIDGTLVQSHYRGHWIGIILYSENNYSDKDTVYMVKPLECN